MYLGKPNQRPSVRGKNTDFDLSYLVGIPLVKPKQKINVLGFRNPFYLGKKIPKPLEKKNVDKYFFMSKTRDFSLPLCT